MNSSPTSITMVSTGHCWPVSAGFLSHYPSNQSMTSGATVDAWNHAPVEGTVVESYHYLQGFSTIPGGWPWEISHQQYVSFRVLGISRPRYQRVPMRDANVVPFRRLSQWNCVWPRWHSLAQLANRSGGRGCRKRDVSSKQSRRRFSNNVNINILKKIQTHNITQQQKLRVVGYVFPNHGILTHVLQGFKW